METKQQTETTGNCLITSGLMNGVQAIQPNIRWLCENDKRRLLRQEYFRLFQRHSQFGERSRFAWLL